MKNKNWLIFMIFSKSVKLTLFSLFNVRLSPKMIKNAWFLVSEQFLKHESRDNLWQKLNFNTRINPVKTTPRSPDNVHPENQSPHPSLFDLSRFRTQVQIHGYWNSWLLPFAQVSVVSFLIWLSFIWPLNQGPWYWLSARVRTSKVVLKRIRDFRRKVQKPIKPVTRTVRAWLLRTFPKIGTTNLGPVIK